MNANNVTTKTETTSRLTFKLDGSPWAILTATIHHADTITGVAHLGTLHASGKMAEIMQLFEELATYCDTHRISETKPQPVANVS
jgi:hypothetical protein